MNKLNLEKFGVQELNANEQKHIVGGAWFKVTGLISWITGDASWKDVDIVLFGIDIK